jgi:hypothetical protein
LHQAEKEPKAMKNLLEVANESPPVLAMLLVFAQPVIAAKAIPHWSAAAAFHGFAPVDRRDRGRDRRVASSYDQEFKLYTDQRSDANGCAE